MTPLPDHAATPQSTREWLLSDAPTTRRQARLGALYQGWLVFRANHLAVVGLIILILLIGTAIFAPLLAPFVPTVAPIADDIADPTARERAYPRTPVAGVAAVGRIQRAARRALPRITAPVTVYRSARDAVVPASSHRTLVRGLRQAPVEVVGLPRSRHVATLDHDLPLLIDHGRSAVAAMTTH